MREIKNVLKKIFLLSLVCALVLSCTVTVFAFDRISMDTAELGGESVKTNGGVAFHGSYNYVYFKDVLLTGAKSIIISAKNDMSSGSDGERIIVRIDSPVGEVIGYVDIDVHTHVQVKDYKGSLKTVSGVHDLYFQSSIGTETGSAVTITGFELSGDTYTKEKYVPVSDSNIRDMHETTWALADDLGRRVATYEETGPVREGKKVGMFYWTWFTGFENTGAINISEFAKEHPEARNDYYNTAWPLELTKYYWNEPLFGYYSGIDYWVYRKHAEMLSAAGVDAIFFDATNGRKTWRRSYQVLFTALHDARADGVNAPKVCFMTPFTPSNAEIKENVKRVYLGAYKDDKWSDLWFYWEGKPLILAYTDTLIPIEGDKEDEALMNEIKSFFTFRGPQPSYTSGQTRENQWGWLEVYPQHGYTQNEDGSYEQATVGVAANHSYITHSLTAMNGPYVTGRSYTSVLGQDKSEGAYKYGYFFTEELKRGLEIDPELLFIDGWNEWTAGRNESWCGVKNAFPDTYDNEGSRDMEPTKGDMKDNYYALLVDAVRKFKGTEKRETAGEAKTININNMSDWNGVGPEFYGYKGIYERDAQGYGTVYKNSTARNNVYEAKVSYDDENMYFYALCSNEITAPEGSTWMNIYIDSDRNHATGYEGYDFLINYPEAGSVSKFSRSGELVKIGKAEFNVSGNELAIKVNKSLINISDFIDMEFKWVDNSGKDIMDFYTDGLCAPIGRFNFVYSMKEEKYLTDEERSTLKDTGAVQAGKNVGYVSGKKIYVKDSDSSVTSLNINGMIYVTSDFAAEALDVRAVYEPYKNMLKLRGEKDIYTVLGTLEARSDGYFKSLTNSVIAQNGTVYIPVSLFSDLYGYEVYIEKDHAIFGSAVSDQAKNTLMSLEF